MKNFKLRILPGTVVGSVRMLLMAEGLGIAALSMLLYSKTPSPWWLFAVLFLSPDLAGVGYLLNARIGAVAYNFSHTYAVPIVIGILLLLFHRADWLAVIYIWTAHIGLNRLIGSGLKYPTAFGATHLGSFRIERKPTSERSVHPS